MITLHKLSIGFANLPLLDSADLFVPAGAKCGFVGQNGTGKTTLFNAILGSQDYSGQIELPRNCKVVAIEQNINDMSITPLECVINSDKERTALFKELEEDNLTPERMGDIYDRLLAIDAYTAEGRATEILKGLGFDEDMMLQPLSSLSGGWQKRVCLASALFLPSDLLLLDEPTNHLDLESSVWLLNYLKSYPNTILLISHDRDFLDNLCSHIVHLSGRKLDIYKGNYTSFERQRAEKQELLTKNKEKIAEKRKHLQDFINRFKAKATKARQAQSRIKMLAKIQDVALLPKDAETSFEFPAPKEIAPPLLKVSKANAGYGEKVVLWNLNLLLNPEETVVVLGKNGNGKSTLAKVLADKLPVMQGEVFRSNKLEIGYFAQNLLEDSINKQDTPLEHVLDRMRQLGKPALPKDAMAHLAKFGIVSCADTVCGKISGGQATRLMFALICLSNPNLLILDEPTNHLDIDGKDALIEAINNYEGAVILITHDFHLVEMTADRLWLVDKSHCTQYNEDIEEYKRFLLQG